jgi:Phytanoyl-CoA dioxygenase (PhyH)
MNTVFFDSIVSDETRRERLYNGQLFLFSPRPSMLALCEFAREMLEEAFAPLHPTQAQFDLSVEEFVAIAAPLKPKFIHHPKSKQLVQKVLEEYGYDLEKTYFDVPRLKIITHNAYLTAGVGYPFHPHRDTWYCAPQSQVNWWLPVYEFESESAMAFHPRYWNEPVRNSSSNFNYYEYNSTGRKNAAQYIKADTRNQPRPQDIVEIDPHLRLVCDVGGVILFSGAQMHSTVPNTSGRTRFSIDFRTIHLDDVLAQRGAPNLDAAPTGTALRDFMRGTDLSRIPEEVVALYEDTPPLQGDVIFQPPDALIAS